jgi:hypothetical protein
VINRQCSIVGIACVLLVLLSSTWGTAVQAQTSTPPPTNTPTPTSTPTAIPAVSLGMSEIITTTRQLANDQVNAWNTSADTAPLFLGLAALLFVFGLLALIKALTLWRVQPSEE